MISDFPKNTSRNQGNSMRYNGPQQNYYKMVSSQNYVQLWFSKVF